LTNSEALAHVENEVSGLDGEDRELTSAGIHGAVTHRGQEGAEGAGRQDQHVRGERAGLAWLGDDDSPSLLRA
jgi:hypothetical protein